MSESETPDLTTLTVELLSAYFANNVVASEELAGLIHSTRAALAGTSASGEERLEAPVYKPAVSIKKSIANPDHLLSLIDGKPYKTLKRHLTSHGLTITEYKERYKLPANYPTVAPSYSDARRETANRIGLGNRSAAAAPSSVDAAIIPEVLAAPADKPVKKTPQGSARPAKVKTAAKTKAKVKPRTTKSSLSAETETHAPVEVTAASTPSVIDAKAVRKPRQKAASDAVPVQSVQTTEEARPARKPRAKLKIVAPTA